MIDGISRFSGTTGKIGRLGSSKFQVPRFESELESVVPSFKVQVELETWNLETCK
jgi:hypothetical protein